MTIIIVLGVATALVLFWVVGGRAWLKSKPWSAGFFTAIEPYEIALWRKSETILWARFLWVLGILSSLLAFIGAFDVSPFIAFLPYEHQWWVAALPGIALALNGLVTEVLRRWTSKPLELVELPEEGMSSKVAKAVAAAEIKKEDAVAVVEQARAEHKL